MLGRDTHKVKIETFIETGEKCNAGCYCFTLCLLWLGSRVFRAQLAKHVIMKPAGALVYHALPSVAEGEKLVNV